MTEMISSRTNIWLSPYTRRIVGAVGAVLMVTGVADCGSESYSAPSGHCIQIPEGSSISKELGIHVSDVNGVDRWAYAQDMVDIHHGTANVRAGEWVELSNGADRHYDQRDNVRPCSAVK